MIYMLPIREQEKILGIWKESHWIGQTMKTVRAKLSPKYNSTNISFSKGDEVFIAACLRAGIKPTKRQASKFRSKRGTAYSNY